MEWFKKHWSSVVTVGCVAIAAFIQAWQEAATNVPASVNIPRLQGAWHYVPLLLLISAGVVWLIARPKKASQPQTQVQTTQAPGLPAGIPALSSLLGQEPNITFNPKQFFALAHYSPVTAETEKNIQIVANRYYPNDKESFYVRFIGVGLMSYHYDVTWLIIYGSQIAALGELNTRGLIPIADLKKHYEKASVDFPKAYSDYSFQQWLDFMKNRSLIAIYPSQMVELSWCGKDFIKYLAHTGRTMVKSF